MGRLTALLLLVLVGGPAFAGPRAASLGLCTDELLLLLAPREQIASISFLGALEEETELARRAGGIPTNDGSLESALRHAPDLVVTGGPVNRRARALAERIGVPVLDLPPPQSVEDMISNIARLGQALGREMEAKHTISRITETLKTPPQTTVRALKIDSGGFAGNAEGAAAELLRYAGIELPSFPSLKVGRERLLLDPPAFVIRSRYRQSQTSRSAAWSPPDGPWETLWLDGRRWTCPGPLAVLDVMRLRQKLGAEK